MKKVHFCLLKKLLKSLNQRERSVMIFAALGSVVVRNYIYNTSLHGWPFYKTRVLIFMQVLNLRIYFLKKKKYFSHLHLAECKRLLISDRR